MAESCDYLTPQNSSRTPKMKKTTNSNCLAGLDDHSSLDADSYLSTSGTSSFGRQSCRALMPSSSCQQRFDVDVDDNFVYYIRNSSMHKRPRSRLGSAR